MKSLFLSLILITFSLSSFSQDVVFVHGNAKDMRYWTQVENGLAKDVTKVANKVFYANYLTEDEIKTPFKNYHKPLFYERIKEEFDKSDSNEITVIAHSFGVTLTLATLEYFGLWHRVKKIISFAGALKGLESCRPVGPYNAQVPSCYGQSRNNPYVFGFFPGSGRINDWTASYYYSFINMPRQHRDIEFISISIGLDDSLICRNALNPKRCSKSALFNEYGNVRNYVFENQGLDHFTLPNNVDRDFVMSLL